MRPLETARLQIILLSLLLGSCHGYYLSGTDLGIKIAREAEEALGGDEIEKVMDERAEFTTSVPNGEAIVDNLATQLGNRFNTYNKAVIALRDKIVEIQKDFSNKRVDTECCKLTEDELSYDIIFRKNVDKKKLCFRLAASIDRDELDQLKFAPKALTDTMRANAVDIPNLGWQYFGSELGVQHIYPRSISRDCYNYDPRLRPWYAEANAPTAKDIVIVFDFLKYDGNLGNLVALEIILKTTNPNDRLAMVAVGNPEPRTPLESCFANSLAQASKRNQEVLLNFMRAGNDSVSKGSDYQKAFEKAFTYFMSGNRKDGASKRRKLLIFMTDSNPRGASYTKTITEKVSERNKKVNNSVVIQTFSFGRDIDDDTDELLAKLANDTKFVTAGGIHKRGKYTKVESEKDVRTQLTSLFNTFAESGAVKRPVVTAPYEDFSGLGTIISLCLPVHGAKDELKGVTCIDAKILDIFYNVSYFRERKLAYAFLIDDKGRAIIHPRMPPASKDRNIFLHISTLEREASEAGVITSMIKGDSASKTLYVRMKHSGGSLYGQYKESEIVTATYYWQRVPNSNFSICVVITGQDSDIQVKVKDQNDLRKSRYLNHRAMEVKPDGYRPCRHLGTNAAKDKSTVVFAGDALQGLQYHSDAMYEIQKYSQYFSGSGQGLNGFRNGTREWVYLGGLVDTLWRDRKRGYSRKIYWRYLTICSGVARMYPGARFNDAYIPSKMPWYKDALENPRRTVLTKSNSNEAGHARVVLSRAINVGSPRQRPAGVIAGEFRPAFFYDLLLQTYPDCSKKTARCFILDGKGNILAHKHLETDEHVHILHMEPKIAKHLIDKGQLIQTTCMDFEMFRTLRSWVVSIEDFIATNPWGEVHTVFGTNVFVGIAFGEKDTYIKPSNNSDVVECSEDRMHPVCQEVLNFDYCNNTFREEDQSKKSVTCNSAAIVQPVAGTQSKVSMEPCWAPDCSERLTKTDCLQYVGCHWCYDLEQKSNTEACRNEEQCAANPPDQGPKLIKILLPVLLCLALILLLVLIIVCIKKGWWHKCICQMCPRRTSPHPQPEVAYIVDSPDGIWKDEEGNTVQPAPAPERRANQRYTQQRPAMEIPHEALHREGHNGQVTNHNAHPDPPQNGNPLPLPSRDGRGAIAPLRVTCAPAPETHPKSPATPESRPPLPEPRNSQPPVTPEIKQGIETPNLHQSRSPENQQSCKPPLQNDVGQYGSYPRLAQTTKKTGPPPPIPKAQTLPSTSQPTEHGQRTSSPQDQGTQIAPIYANKDAVRLKGLTDGTIRSSMGLGYPDSDEFRETPSGKSWSHDRGSEDGAAAVAESANSSLDQNGLMYSTIYDLPGPSVRIEGAVEDESLETAIQPTSQETAGVVSVKKDSGFQSELDNYGDTKLKHV